MTMRRKSNKISAVPEYTLDLLLEKRPKYSSKSIFQEDTTIDEDIRECKIKSTKNVTLQRESLPRKKTIDLVQENSVGDLKPKSKASVDSEKNKGLPSLKDPDRFFSPQPHSFKSRFHQVNAPKASIINGDIKSVSSNESQEIHVEKSGDSVQKRSAKASGFFSTRNNHILKTCVFPLTDKRNKSKNSKFKNLGNCLEDIEAKVLFSPQASHWKFSKASRMKQLKKPYKI